MTWAVVLAFAKRHWQLIAAGLVILAVMAWAGAGHSEAKRLADELKQANESLRLRTVERDQARDERAAALGAAEACSRSIEEMKVAADEQRKAAEAAQQQARQSSQKAGANAKRILATPAALPGNDAASARVRVNKWLEGR